jgi:hypothetical protein
MTNFYMYEPRKRRIIAKHKFFFEQAIQRFLVNKEEMQRETDAFVEKWMHDNQDRFDSEADAADIAFDRGLEYYELLDDMQMYTKLSIVANIFHLWDKQVREWLDQEFRQIRTSETTKDALWKKPFDDIMNVMNLILSVKGKPYFETLETCHLLVNVYKHGDGKSFTALKNRFPKYLLDPDTSFREEIRRHLMHYDYIYIEESDLDLFSEAIVNFWQDIPETIPINITHFESLPWLAKAIHEDLQVITAQEA